jgi:large subunit ribosomal protein L14e
MLAQAIIDGPTTGVARQPFPYRHLSLTPLAVKTLPRAAGTGVVKKVAEKEDIAAKWEQSSWAKKRAQVEARRQLSDFDRFQVMLLKKQRRDRARKAVKATKA